jgi:arylsulfatase A-like enzyme
VSDKDLAGVDTGTAQVVPESLETMAEYLKEAGYTTVGIQSNVNLKPDFGLAHGFDTYETWIYPEHRGTTVTDKALEKLREVSSPYFLYVHYMDTHWTYDPPEPHRSAFGSFPELSETDRELLAHYPDYYFDKVFGDLNVKERRMAELSEAGREYVRQLYDGAARYVDAELQRLLTEIERRSPNAIILITGDHGEELWDHNSLGHSKTLYQELIHVPLIVRVPGAPAKRSDAPVHLTDLLPATAGLLGLPARPWWQGSDFLREGGLPGDRLLFSSTYTSLPTNNVHLESVIRGKDKLILDRKKDAARLFDLAGDPAERHDLAEARPEQVAALRQALVEQQEANAKNPAAPKDVEAVELSDELVEQLKAGGYFR